MRLVLVHGRSQQGKDPAKLQQTWQQTLDAGIAAAGLNLPSGTTVSFPFYGDELDKLVNQLNSPLVADVATKGAPIPDKELAFRAELAAELARNAGLSTADIERELEPGVKDKGPLQWEWVHAILKALDRNAHVRDVVLDQFTRDAFVYLTYPAVAKKIDDIVLAAIDGAGPCVVVGHSLGSIVSYRVLTELAGRIDVQAFVTVGSPLGLNAVRNHLPLPLAMPQKVKKWRNAYDERDVVALMPLDKNTWPIEPAIENFGQVKNGTDNAHGIIGYLNDVQVAAWVVEGLA
jgi:hypothetical protein